MGPNTPLYPTQLTCGTCNIMSTTINLDRYSGLRKCVTMTHFQMLPLTVFGKIKDGSSNNGKVNEQEVTRGLH